MLTKDVALSTHADNLLYSAWMSCNIVAIGVTIKCFVVLWSDHTTSWSYNLHCHTCTLVSHKITDNHSNFLSPCTNFLNMVYNRHRHILTRYSSGIVQHLRDLPWTVLNCTRHVPTRAALKSSSESTLHACAVNLTTQLNTLQCCSCAYIDLHQGHIQLVHRRSSFEVAVIICNLMWPNVWEF